MKVIWNIIQDIKKRVNFLSADFKSTQAEKTNGSVKMYLQIQLKLYVA